MKGGRIYNKEMFYVIDATSENVVLSSEFFTHEQDAK